MKPLLSSLLFKIPAVRKAAEKQWRKMKPGMLRSYAAATNSRFTADWIVSTANINDDIRSGLVAIRNRARELWKNNDYVRGLRNRKRTNIIGPEGFKFQSRVKTRKGEVDAEANALIEQAWEDWQKRGSCTMSGKYSFLEICWLWIDQLVRDGEILARKVRGADNKYGFAIELIETDLLDESYTDQLPNGNTVIMGIEFDKWQRPVAYYIGSRRRGIAHKRVPADEIIHHIDPEHAHQVRGISHLAQSMLTFHDLQGYDQAAIIAARAGASKMGFIETDKEFASQYQGDGQDANGDIITSIAAGEIEVLPAGKKFTGWDPAYPHEAYPYFIKAILRRMATGLGLAYANWTGDLEAVNFSSMRSGLQDERDIWMLQQAQFREGVLIPLFQDWLKMALIKGALPGLNYGELDRLNKPQFVGRRWSWVDPVSDVEASIKAMDNNLTTLQEELAKTGKDYDDTIEQRKRELKDIIELNELKRLAGLMDPVKFPAESNPLKNVV